MNHDLAAAIRDAVLDLPGEVLAAIAAVAERHGAWSSLAIRAMSDVSPAANVQAHVVDLSEAWKRVPDLPGLAIALSLTAGCAVASTVRASQRLEIAWTGPAVGIVNARSTAQVFIETVRAARSSLLCLSFAAYHDPVIVREIASAVARGVEVSLILDDPEQSGGALSADARRVFESLGERAAFYVWPADQRPVVGIGLARLHAKALIADHHVAFVTSANLTGAAMQKNIELGLVVHGGAIPRDLEAQVRGMIGSGVLRRVG